MTLARAIAVLAVLIVAAAGPALADGPHKRGHILVSGQGVVRAAPDMATVNIGVVTTAAEAKAAVDANSTAAAALQETLKASGIAPGDIQTVRFSVYPQYENVEGRQQPKIAGYTVENTVQATIRKLDTLGQVLDRVIESGANNVNGIEFGLSDPASAADAARREALKDARRKAELYAADAGVTLGPLIALEELGGDHPTPMAMNTLRASAQAVPVAPGEQQVSVAITVRYAIE